MSNKKSKIEEYFKKSDIVGDCDYCDNSGVFLFEIHSEEKDTTYFICQECAIKYINQYEKRFLK